MQDDRFARSLGYALVRAFRRVNRDCNNLLRPFGLSAEQAHVLLLLWLEGPMKVGELQRALVLSSGTLTGAIDRMEKAGLVRRARDGVDGRAFRVEPTPFDARRRKAVERALEDFENTGFSALSARERRDLLRLLTKVAAASSAEGTALRRTRARAGARAAEALPSGVHQSLQLRRKR